MGGASLGPWGALAGGALGLAGGLYSGSQADSAGNQAAEAQLAAQKYAEQQYQQGRTDLAPYMSAGTGALGVMGQIAGQSQPGFNYQQPDFSFDKYKDPGSQYLMQEAVKAINASSLAKGGMGGGLVKSINTEIGNQANTAYQGAFNRYMGDSQMRNDQAQQKYGRDLGWQQNQFGQQSQIAGMGQGAAQGLAGIGSQLGQYGGNMIAGAGANRASGTLNNAGAIVGGVNSFANQLMKGLGGFSGGSAAPSQGGGMTDWMSVFNNSSDNLLGDI